MTMTRSGTRPATLMLALLAMLAGCTTTSPASTPAAPTETASASVPARVSPSPAAAPTTSARAVCAVPDRFRGIEVSQLPVTAKVVALTFDAGANADAVAPIRRTLIRTGVPATFFLTGQWVQRYPVRSARLGSEHLIGNHTVSHPDLTTLSDAAVRAQISTAQTQITRATGQDPRRFFRFPYGARNARVIGLANQLCYVPFRWTVDTLGWKGTSGGMTAAAVVRRVLAALRPGEIVLMHVGSHPTDHSTLDADALPTIIREVQARGYTFVRLSRVMSPAP
jgi:peptidoglycan/xylan/chitin deacetylase (PgdA/CDA1 family)